MRLNGASKPHGVLPYVGSSTGANNRDYINRNRNQIKGITNNTINNNNNIGNNSNSNKYKISSNITQSKITSNNSNRNSRLIIKSPKISLGLINTIIMRIQQSNNSPYFMFIFCLLYILCLLPNHVVCDDNDNGFFVHGFSLGPEITTPEFDYASRGSKKFGDKCDNTLECGFPGSVCDPKMKSCQCTEDLSVTNHIDKCGKEAAINETCFFNEQCESLSFQTECRDGRCVCRFEMMPSLNKDGNYECKAKPERRGPERFVDPAMIGVLVGMALMFIIICVVLRLFSRARWRENRTIFNTPNPRLMNVSLLRENKLLHGQERRGSRMSVRVPSRQPSMASLRPHSPNPSLGSRRGSHGSSNASGASTRSNRSNAGITTNLINGNNHDSPRHGPHYHQSQQQQPLVSTNITSNPTAENVTVEIIEPKS